MSGNWNLIVRAMAGTALVRAMQVGLEPTRHP